MKWYSFFLLASVSLLCMGCDPKVDQRAPRYNPEECPICLSSGECRTCDGTGKCSHCKGTGTRVTSTKNYTGEGVALVDYEEECPFCAGTGKCDHCKGSALCNSCQGKKVVDTTWPFLKDGSAVNNASEKQGE